VLRALAQMPQAPRVVLVSTSAADSDLAVEALQLGAVDLVQKPTATATDRLYELGDELIEKVRVAALSAVRLSDEAEKPSLSDVPTTSGRTKVIVLGTSTGGPQALTKLFSALPGTLQAPLAVVLHIPPGYTRTLAERLDRSSALTVLEAEQDLEIGPGMAVIARAGIHLRLVRSGETSARCDLDPMPMSVLHRPSVDELFISAARAFGEGVLGVVLTGMGDDGLRGARAIHESKGRILTEHPDSCVVYGMPAVIKDAGLATAEAHLDRMAAVIVNHL
jgi:two-component system chemotaxis response regulator CheB